MNFLKKPNLIPAEKYSLGIHYTAAQYLIAVVKLVLTSLVPLHLASGFGCGSNHISLWSVASINCFFTRFLCEVDKLSDSIVFIPPLMEMVLKFNAFFWFGNLKPIFYTNGHRQSNDIC